MTQSNISNQPPKKPSTLMNFLTAGAGGISGWMFVHPFNTAAIRMNLAATQPQQITVTSVEMSPSGMASVKVMPNQGSKSFPSFLMKTIRNEGILSLYKGLSAGLLRQVFYATSRFGLFEVFRDEMAKYYGPTDFFSRLVTGAASGAAAAFISCPAEVTLVRISNDSSLPKEARRNYKGVFNAFQRILSEEGVKTFFSGSGPFVNRAILVGAVQVGTYDQFRELYKVNLGVKDELSNVFAAAMTSGLIYSIITMPLETAKNRMAFQKPDPVTNILPYRSTIQTLTAIAKKEGTMQLWKGFSPYYLRCGGHTVAMFSSMAWMRKNLL